MRLSIKDSEVYTILEIDVWVKYSEGIEFVEIRCQVDIERYSFWLLKLEESKRESFIKDVASLYDIRHWLWQEYFAQKPNVPSEYDGVLEEVRKKLNEIGPKYGMYKSEE
jgi:hypothetical protein